MSIEFPPGVHVFVRGWLSSNNILIVSADTTALVDSSYCTHGSQTLSLVRSVLGARPLDMLVNTHLHSDHCGGNAALQAAYPSLRTLIPPGHAPEVSRWDEYALTYKATGQQCPRFKFDGLLQSGSTLTVGNQAWQIHAAAGHDPHSVVLFEPQHEVLVSADALWEEGFGVVFPELEGVSAFEEVSTTLDLIERLNPKAIIPGHGRPFDNVKRALRIARDRLDFFVAQPAKHRQYAAKVLLKFKLLELQTCSWDELLHWGGGTPYLEQLRQVQYPHLSMPQMIDSLISDLCKSGAAIRIGDQVKNGA